MWYKWLYRLAESVTDGLWRVCIAEIEVVLACQSSCREESPECFGFVCPGEGDFQEGLPFGSFQLDSTFF